MANINIIIRGSFFYWFILALLFFLQFLFTLNSTNQIRYEELSESVRNPFWLNSRYMFEGGASVSWNLFLLIIYNLFGFSLFAAKFVKLGIFAISLFCLWGVLKKYLGRWRAVVPLVVTFLSPTLLYLNILQSAFGIDLLLLPICAYLLLSIDFKKLVRSKILIRTFLLWFLVMVSWLAYPTFLFYLPALFLSYFYRLIKSSKSKGFLLVNITVSLLGFLAPLLAVILYVKNKEVLIYDSVGQVGSLFRGNGYFDFSIFTFIKNFAFNLYYLFYRSGGYHFEVSKVDFSDFYPILTLLVVVWFIFKLFKNKKYKALILLIGSVVVFNVTVAYFTPDMGPGMRRFTPILAAIYAFFVLVWHYLTSSKTELRFRKFYILILSLLVLHHLIVYPINLIHLKDLGVYYEKFWFTKAETPKKSLDEYLGIIQKEDLYLECPENSRYCRYSEIYAAIAASCWWRGLVCHEVLGWWPKAGKFIPISIDTWKVYNFRY
ncbi:hypothetical protein HYU92_05980 [Candidatus Curtissbacteria bacterium]|nr:hypothetical protein [Candidatus Curtissbacteria bacterium]